ncbi:MAG: hypothetical protein ABIH82_05970 [Candidatus Woesearchaeota archaeon]
MRLVTGFLLLVNAFLWPRWLGVDGWVAFVAVLMVIGGFLKMVVPACKDCCNKGGVCAPAKPMTAKKARKR